MRFVRILVLGALAAGLAACGDDSGGGRVDAPAIRGCLAAYHDAVTRGDGAAAARDVSAKTLELFGSLRDVALMGDRTTVSALPVNRKVQVLALRAALPADELEAMTDDEVFALVVTRGWIDAGALDGVTLGEIDDEGADAATAVVVVDGEATDQGIRFVLEDGRWRIDLYQSLGESDRVEKTRMMESGVPEDDWVLQRVESYLEAPPPDSIWTPPQPVD